MTQSRIISVALLSVSCLGFTLAGKAATPPAYGSDPSRPAITVVFRMDDYSDAMSLSLETAILTGIQRYRTPVVFGAIPYLPGKEDLSRRPDLDQPLSRARADRLRPAIEAGLLEIAQHGYSHRSNAAGGLSGDSEFSGIPTETQRAWILKGKELLEGLFGRPVVSFCPPFNRYDVITVRVLAASGFTTLSAGGYCHADESTGLRYLPATCKLMQLPLAVEAARKGMDPQPVIVALFHPYDFIEEEAARGFIHYADLDALLAWVSQQRDVRVVTLDRVGREIGDLGAARYRAFYQCHALSRLLPEALIRRIYPPSAYWTVHGSRMWAIQFAAWLMLLLGAGCLFGWLLARGTSSGISRRPCWLGWVGAAVLVAGLVRFLLHPGFLGALIAAVGAGVVAGGVWSRVKK
jgi:hypothetical protein